MSHCKLIFGIGILSLLFCSCKPKVEDNTGSSFPVAKDSTADIVADTFSAVYSSSDFGKTWQPMSTGLPKHLKVTGLEKVGHELVLATEDAGLFMTENNKSTWKDIGTGLATKNINTLYVHGDEVYLGLSHQGVTMWKLNSAYWNAYNNNLPNRNVLAILKVKDELVIGTDMGIFKSSGHIDTWTGKMVGEKVMSLAMTGDTLYAGTIKGVMMSKDGGENWTYVHKGEAFQSLIQQDKKIYAAYTSGAVFVVDYRGNWKEVRYNPKDQSPVYDVTQANDQFLMSNRQGVFQSPNGKTNWQLIFPQGNYWFVDLVGDRNVVYAATAIKN